MKRNFKSCLAINYAYKTNIFIVEKEIKMFFLFYWSFLIVCCFADKINLNEKHEISLDIGLYPQTSLNFFVSIDSTIRLQTNRNISLISKTSTTLFDTGQHDYITVANYPPIFTTIAHILEEPNLVSLGWLSAYMGCDVSIFENILYYCTVPKQFSRYKTRTVLDMSHCYTNEIIKTPDTILHQNNLNICLDEILDIIKIPQSLMLIDRTKKECISFKNIFGSILKLTPSSEVAVKVSHPCRNLSSASIPSCSLYLYLSTAFSYSKYSDPVNLFESKWSEKASMKSS